MNIATLRIPYSEIPMIVKKAISPAFAGFDRISMKNIIP